MTKPWTLLNGDAVAVLKTLPDASVQCCVTSPPYWGLRRYLPDRVRLKEGVPTWVKQELEKLGIKPVDECAHDHHKQ